MFDINKKYSFKKTHFILGAIVCSIILIGSLDAIKNLEVKSLLDLSYRDYFFLLSVPLLSGTIGFLILEIIRKKNDFFILKDDSIFFHQNGDTKKVFLDDVLEIRVEDLEKQKRKKTIYIITKRETIELCLRYFEFDVNDLVKKITEQPNSEKIKVFYIS